MFKKDNKLATIYRQTQTTEWWYKKSWFSATWWSYYWNLKALTLSDWIDFNSFGRAYEFHTDINSDIKESDKLLIDWEYYEVKGIANFNWITFSRKMVVLNKTENGT